jgi:hypothetical protein
MTVQPSKDVRNVHAKLYQAQHLIADVLCQLWPAEAPLRGTALIPGRPDLLFLGTLLLDLSSGERYRVVPTTLDGTASGDSRLSFCVGLKITPAT